MRFKKQETVVNNNWKLIMFKIRTIVPFLLIIIYCFLCILALIYQISRPETDKFSGIFMVALTLPWSFLEALFHDLVVASIFNYRFTVLFWYITFVLWVIINTILLFMISRRILKKNK